MSWEEAFEHPLIKEVKKQSLKSIVPLGSNFSGYAGDSKENVSNNAPSNVNMSNFADKENSLSSINNNNNEKIISKKQAVLNTTSHNQNTG